MECIQKKVIFNFTEQETQTERCVHIVLRSYIFKHGFIVSRDYHYPSSLFTFYFFPFLLPIHQFN